MVHVAAQCCGATAFYVPARRGIGMSDHGISVRCKRGGVFSCGSGTTTRRSPRGECALKAAGRAKSRCDLRAAWWFFFPSKCPEIGPFPRGRRPRRKGSQTEWRADRHSNPRWLFDACITNCVKSRMVMQQPRLATTRKEPVPRGFRASSFFAARPPSDSELQSEMIVPQDVV